MAQPIGKAAGFGFLPEKLAEKGLLSGSACLDAVPGTCERLEEAMFEDLCSAARTGADGVYNRNFIDLIDITSRLSRSWQGPYLTL